MADPILTRIIENSPTLSAIFGTRMPRYRYWETKGRIRWMCGWTVERDSDGKFVAFIYKLEKGRGQYRLVKKMAFKRRNRAKERAWRWYQGKAGIRPSGEPGWWIPGLLSRKKAMRILEFWFPWMVGGEPTIA